MCVENGKLQREAAGLFILVTVIIISPVNAETLFSMLGLTMQAAFSNQPSFEEWAFPGSVIESIVRAVVI